MKMESATGGDVDVDGGILEEKWGWGSDITRGNDWMRWEQRWWRERDGVRHKAQHRRGSGGGGKWCHHHHCSTSSLTSMLRFETEHTNIAIWMKIM